MQNNIRQQKGISLVNLILFVMIILVAAVLAYGILYVDVFEIADRQEETFKISSNVIKEDDMQNSYTGNTQKNQVDIAKENVIESQGSIIPILNETVYEAPNIITTADSHYYYEQLNETGKIIYKGLEDNIENLKSGNYKINFGTQFNSLLKSEHGEEKLNMSFQSAWNAFSYDYPDIFYIDITKMILTTQTTTIMGFSTHKVSLSNDGYNNYFSKGISSEATVRSRENYIKTERDKIISQLQGLSQYQQIKQAHDWVVDNLQYDTTYKKSDIHNIYGAFANKEVVCEGYARLYKYILDGLEIENVLVSGTATNSKGKTESHAWNYVKLGEKWYAVDTTWDDPVMTNGGTLTDTIKYQYFLKGSTTFFKNHKEDRYLSRNSMKFEFPTLEKEDY